MTDPFVSDFPWSVDQLLPSTINLRGFRPNLLVNCSIDELQHVASELVPLCAPPVKICLMPGTLKLAPRFAGTMLLTRLEEMTVDQQIALFDWLSDVHPNVQVVSVATARIDTMVREGRFLEGLFYRLNVVRVDASRARVSGHRRVDASPLAVNRLPFAVDKQVIYSYFVIKCAANSSPISSS